MIKRAHVSILAPVLGLALLSPLLLNADDASSRPASRPAGAASKPAKKAKSFQQQYAKAIEAAHGGAKWSKAQIFEADLELHFGGKLRFQAHLVMDTQSARTRLELKSGETIGFDGKDVWITPAKSKRARARFDALTWSYFVAAPWKLRDPGSHLVSKGSKTLKGKALETAKLTFDKGVGDAPDDWYLCYRDPQSKQLTAMAYIVTFGKGKDGVAKAKPHAITYEKVKTVSGVSLATHWQFWNWSESKGVHGKRIGHAQLSGMKFSKRDLSRFAKPKTARSVPLK